MNRPPFETGQVYHIYNRGTDKRKIFLDSADYMRFTNGLIEFNNENPSLNVRYKNSIGVPIHEVQPREKLVEIFAYCLMPNHYHLMLRQMKDNGISLFMKKVGTGYTMYFNMKEERSGALFQGRFKSVLIDRDEYLRYLPHYIHLNPVELSTPAWKERKTNKIKIQEILQSYRWSSYSEFAGTRKTPELLDVHTLKETYEPNGYRTSLDEWLDQFDLEPIQHILLD